jgi:NAD(P)-dependent dehydrogenase (short-subunit alcohol dehydrogenase family)
MAIPSLSLEGKVAVITGGRMGVGKSTALMFAEAGADIAICDIIADDGKMDEVAEEIKKMGRRCLTAKTDVSVKAEVDNFFKEIVDEYGTVDVLVNNVGIASGKPGFITVLEEDELDRMMRTNLYSVYFCCQAAAKIMMEKETGNIINLASQAAFKSFPGGSVYCVAKAGVVMLTRVLAHELGGSNIRINAIAPSVITTEFMSPIIKLDWENPEIRESASKGLPLRRVSDAEEIASVALFLASDLSSYMTGDTVFVDGGAMA